MTMHSIFSRRSPQTVTHNRTHASLRCLLPALGISAILACKDLVGSQGLPAGAADPTSYDDAAGAFMRADGTRAAFRVALNGMLLASGTLADELTVNKSVLNARRIVEGGNVDSTGTYAQLHNARVQAALAVTSLRKYVPDSSARRAEMFAIQGYAEVMLADLFCSGIPLTLPTPNDEIDYQPGSSTDDVYAHAVTLFDSALVLASGDSSVLTLARVGKGRALLARGNYTDAARAVAAVETGESYALRLVVGTRGINGKVETIDFIPYSVADVEGGNGLPFRSSRDPRTPWTTVTDTAGTTFYPTKYPSVIQDSTSFTVATGVEARLIEAEADLRAGGTEWLTILNGLRTDGTTTATVRTDVPGVSPGPAGVVDTTWGSGTGVELIPGSVRADAGPQCDAAPSPCTDTTWYKGLRPLPDPGDAASRITLLFSERAYWLYLTGHRQGDLRRLIRQYGRQQQNVYPTGPYAGLGTYGNEVTLPIPESEKLNPLFHGCLNHGA